MQLMLAIVLVSRIASYVDSSFELLILHNSDMNGRIEESIEEGKRVGGMGRVSHVIKESRKAAAHKKGPPVLYFNAGDVYTDPVWRNPFSKKIAIEFMNVLMPDVACFGNHDLDYGLEHIRPFMKRAKFPLVAANLRFTNTTYLTNIVRPSMVFIVRGVRIGVVGYITPKNHLLYKQSSVVLEDEFEAVERECGRLKDDGVNVIIALGHSGIDVDRRIANEIYNVDIVIGGLTNTFLWNGKPPHVEVPHGPYPNVIVQASGKKVILVTTYGFTKYMGKLLVNFDEKFTINSYTGTPLFLDESIPQDPVITRLLDTYSSAVRGIQDDSDVLGKSIVYLSAQDARDAESNLGNFITDAFVEFMAVRHRKFNAWTDTPIALINAGAIRKSIGTYRRTPNITRRKLTEVLPFRQRIVVVTMIGAVLLETLENAVRSNGETRGGEFLQMSGMRVNIDYSKPRGHRIREAKAYCDYCHYPAYEHVNPNKHYNILVNTFLANSGDGHETFKTKALSFRPVQAYELDVLSEVLKIYEYIRPETEERITYANEKRRRKTVAASSVIYVNKLSLVVFCCFAVIVDSNLKVIMTVD